MLIDSILSAEMRIDSNSDSAQTIEDIDAMPPYSWNSICNQLSHTVVDWALAVPHFTELSPDDQLMLVKAGIFTWRASCFNDNHVVTVCDSHRRVCFSRSDTKMWTVSTTCCGNVQVLTSSWKSSFFTYPRPRMSFTVNTALESTWISFWKSLLILEYVLAVYHWYIVNYVALSTLTFSVKERIFNPLWSINRKIEFLSFSCWHTFPFSK